MTAPYGGGSWYVDEVSASKRWQFLQQKKAAGEQRNDLTFLPKGKKLDQSRGKRSCL